MQLDLYGASHVDVGDASDCPWRWPGQYEDEETGLYYNRFRYYDAGRGGYISQDPIRINGGLSLFSYPEDPLRQTDAYGLKCDDPVQAGEGGRFGDLDARAQVGDDLTPHHMPQAALGFTSRADGGAVAMTAEEHALTRTYGALGRATKEADADMPFRDVLAKDIRDMRSIVGSKYDQGARDMLQYYRNNSPNLMAK